MEANMGRARARASQIYCVVRPERNAVKRERSGVLTYFNIFLLLNSSFYKFSFR